MDPLIRVEVVHKIDIPEWLGKSIVDHLRSLIMSEVTDFVAQATAEFDSKFNAAKALIDERVASLRADLEEIRTRLAEGDLSTEDMTALQDMEASHLRKLDALNPESPTTMADLKKPLKAAGGKAKGGRKKKG
jgi:hypothetical protein